MKSVADREEEHRQAKLELIRARIHFFERLAVDPAASDERLLAASRRYKITEKNLHKARKREAEMTEEPKMSTFPPAKSVEDIQPMPPAKETAETVLGLRCPCGHLVSVHAPSNGLQVGDFKEQFGACSECPCKGLMA